MTKQQLNWYMLRHDLSRLPEKIHQWIAWHLPREVQYWAAIRLAAHATTGKFGDTSPSELTYIEALERWNQKN